MIGNGRLEPNLGRQAREELSVKVRLGIHIDAAILILRLASATVFVYHGSAVLLGVLGGPGPERFAASIHQPAAIGYLVGIAEFAGVWQS
jgi:uncharacterized membrane protein YphA (DoxX/SURF4 family)